MWVLGACLQFGYELELTEKPSDDKHAKDYRRNDCQFPTRLHGPHSIQKVPLSPGKRANRRSGYWDCSVPLATK